MILIDCGNSSLKVQYCRHRELRTSFSSNYQSGWQQRLAHWLGQQAATSCTFASVLDAGRQQAMDHILTDRYGPSITRLVSQAEHSGVINGYIHPETLGVDRWLALIAAAQICSGDCIVIDAGSAITLDLLRGDGQHLGGAILPGVNTSLDDFKRIFRHIDFSAEAISQSEHPGCSTEAAIQIDYGQNSLSLITKLVNRWSKILGQELDIVIAGGDAARVQKIINQPSRIMPDLVFEGMKLIKQ